MVGSAVDKLEILVKKLSSFSLRCSGSSSFSLASSMSLLMAVMRASVKTALREKMITCRDVRFGGMVECEDGNLGVQVRVLSYQASHSFSLDGCSPPWKH